MKKGQTIKKGSIEKKVLIEVCEGCVIISKGNKFDVKDRTIYFIDDLLDDGWEVDNGMRVFKGLVIPETSYDLTQIDINDDYFESECSKACGGTNELKDDCTKTNSYGCYECIYSIDNMQVFKEYLLTLKGEDK